ncbi:hypothetical protein, partial [Rhizobium leguminosarum]|uniref:hypothetical protein n=1 Tax=Rhizobium leguminosarum TaxID=384 RepID=UPI003F9E3DFC
NVGIGCGLDACSADEQTVLLHDWLLPELWKEYDGAEESRLGQERAATWFQTQQAVGSSSIQTALLCG